MSKYAQFTTEKEAKDFTNFVHDYLRQNRKGYKEQTERWSEVLKHQSEDLYAIPLPPERIPGEYKTIDNIDGWLLESEWP